MDIELNILTRFLSRKFHIGIRIH